MKPARQGFTFTDCRGAANQDEERGLKGVVGIVGVGQDATANPKDHRAMTFDQGRESKFRGLAVAGQEAVDKLRIREAGDGPDVEERPQAERRGG